ncbi:MAG: 30S ribosomal protein S4 [Nanohaloarchaea archaeon SW_7_46_7]|nr:MAG: 30S ribosomal protein S4 [Nanohaloarchaea archaeon SW_7_46_7]
MVKKLQKQYETPNEGWDEERIQDEHNLIEEYGLKNKREVYKAQSQLRSIRREARKLNAAEDEEQKEDLVNKTQRLGLTKSGAALEDILTLRVEDFLNRRLQTAVNRRGYSDTIREARQLVSHGHVYVDGQKVTIPSYLLTTTEEKNIEVELPEPSEEESEDSDESQEAENQETEENEEGEE